MAGSSGFRYYYRQQEYDRVTDHACYCLVSFAKDHHGLSQFAFYIVGEDFSRRNITAEVLARAEKGKPS